MKRNSAALQPEATPPRLPKASKSTDVLPDNGKKVVNLSKKANFTKNKRPAVDLSPDQITCWKSSGNKSMTEEQVQILSKVFSHIRKGTGAPGPVREIEREFHRLNKISVNRKIQNHDHLFDPVTFQIEVKSEDIEPDLPIRFELFSQKICPSYFNLENQWNKMNNTINHPDCDWRFFMINIFPEIDLQVFGERGKIIKLANGNKIFLNGSIDPAVFVTLFEAGFICKCVVNQQTNKMIQRSSINYKLKEFFGFLIKESQEEEDDHDDDDYGVVINSASPLFYKGGIKWVTINDFVKNPPKIFPSIHVIQEKRNLSQINVSQDQLHLAQDGVKPNEVARARGLRTCIALASSKEEGIQWSDHQRFLFKVETDRHVPLLAKLEEQGYADIFYQSDISLMESSPLTSHQLLETPLQKMKSQLKTD